MFGRKRQGDLEVNVGSETGIERDIGRKNIEEMTPEEFNEIQNGEKISYRHYQGFKKRFGGGALGTGTAGIWGYIEIAKGLAQKYQAPLTLGALMVLIPASVVAGNWLGRRYLRRNGYSEETVRKQ